MHNINYISQFWTLHTLHLLSGSLIFSMYYHLWKALENYCWKWNEHILKERWLVLLQLHGCGHAFLCLYIHLSVHSNREPCIQIQELCLQLCFLLISLLWHSVLHNITLNQMNMKGKTTCPYTDKRFCLEGRQLCEGISIRSSTCSHSRRGWKGMVHLESRNMEVLLNVP